MNRKLIEKTDSLISKEKPTSFGKERIAMGVSLSIATIAGMFLSMVIY